METMEEGQNHPKNAHKRIKIEEATEREDEISGLPDCILLEILSRLPFTKDAIRTGTLSKRWEHLWTVVPTLSFKLSNPPNSQRIENPNTISESAKLVDQFLTRCSQMKLKKFKVETIYYRQFESQYFEWIRQAIKCHVEELHLDFHHPRMEGSEADIRLDQSHFFINSCLTDLRLSCFTLNPSGAISWKNLRSPCISSQNLNEHLIVNILSGSPLLENLELEYYYEMTSESDNEFEAPYSSQWPELKLLKKFKVSAVCHNIFISQVKSWIRYVIKCNVKNICISLWLDQGSEYGIPIDEIIFTSSCVTDLRLDRCMMNSIGAISWKNLTSLHISDGFLDDNVIENILSQFVMGESSKDSMMEEGQHHPKNTDKRIKIEELMEKGGNDKISALPDCVLLEILSRLPSTKYAIRTGTLSKRWTHLWTWIPTLIFRLSYEPYQCLENSNLDLDFVLSVSKTITQCRQLKKLKVDTFYHMQCEVQYNNWIRHAINCNVEELDLNFRSLGRELGLRKEFPSLEEELWLDQSNFFINSCFTDLRLSCFTLNPSGAISWKNLRSLCISSQNLNEDLIVNILSGSPLLENLCLEYDYEMAVKSDVESDEEFKAPYSSQWPQLEHLKKFEMSAVCHNLFASQVKSWIRYVIKCNVKNICISLWLDDRSEDELPIDEIIFTSSCVTDLRLDRCMINPVGAISWKNLTSLCISNCCLNDDMIENILSGSPVLETLVLDGCFGYTRLDITSNSVKNLVLSGRMGSYSNSEPKDAIEMNAPNILSLTIQNEMINKRTLLLVNVSSLVKANLNYEFRDIWFDHKTIPMEVEEMLKNHMMNIGHVKELKIGDLCYKALSCLRDKGFVFPSNVKFPDQLKG